MKQKEAIKTSRPQLCECCGRTDKRGFQLCLDHDHDTHELRGWLCSECNTGIGKLGDNILGLERALSYLRSANLEHLLQGEP